MRTLIAFLVVAFVAAAWWSTRGAEPVAPNARLQTVAANAKASPAPQAAVTSEPVYAAPRATPAAATSLPAPVAAPPLQFAVLAAVVIPGEKPALTLLIGGDSVTVREGEIVAGYRVERIDRDRVTLVHVASGARSERLYADASPAPAPGAIASAAPAGGGPFAAQGAASPAATVDAMSRSAASAATSTAPSANYVAPRPPPGATVHDNPLVGAILPSVPGQAPPGMTGPRPSPARPGDPIPQGPVPMPVPPNAQGPVRR